MNPFCLAAVMNNESAHMLALSVGNSRSPNGKGPHTPELISNGSPGGKKNHHYNNSGALYHKHLHADSGRASTPGKRDSGYDCLSGEHQSISKVFFEILNFV